MIRGYGCADLNRDEFVNFIDFALLAADWLDCTDLEYPCNYEGEQLYFIGDIDVDKYVHYSDLAALAGKWLEDIEWLRPPPPPLPPGQASNPNPPDDSIDIDLYTTLSWTAGSGATSHDVYFGTSNPPPFICNQTDSTFDTDTSYYETTYYWRIDEINILGKTIGVIWSFTTLEGPPPP